MAKTFTVGNGLQRGERHPVWGAVVLAFVCTGAAGACGPAQPDAGDEANGGDTSGPGEARAAGCATAPGLDAPRTILEVVDQVNALPKPVSLPCFLATLPRPLELHASQSIFSAQPATGRRSPRMFIFSGALTLTIVPDGRGSRLLEFGEARSDTTSLKGEIEFPVSSELGDEAPFERLMFMDNSTTCSACHAGEEPAEDITFTRAFVSQALRPAPGERVSLSELLTESGACDLDAEPERCAMLNAVLGDGDVVDGEFPATTPTFY
jgi:hypothetical protein